MTSDELVKSYNENKEKSEKRKVGRPKKKIKVKRYTIALKPDIYEKALAKATSLNISFSALVRIVLIDYFDRHSIKNHHKEDNKNDRL